MNSDVPADDLEPAEAPSDPSMLMMTLAVLGLLGVLVWVGLALAAIAAVDRWSGLMR